MATAADTWRVLGRLTDASNATLLVDIDGVRHVYKPVAGEAPLWDFPTGTLGRREVAVHDLAHALGWDVVPPTQWTDTGPFGPGMVQRWVDEANCPVAVFPPAAVPAGWLPVLRGVADDDEPIVVAHRDLIALRRLAVFDLVANNADRKAGHLLAVDDDTILGIDHGLCLHEEPKLRTVLWGFAGQPIPDELLGDLDRVAPRLPQVMAGLARSETAAAATRIADLLDRPVFPEPPARGPVIPWPLW